MYRRNRETREPARLADSASVGRIWWHRIRCVELTIDPSHWWCAGANASRVVARATVEAPNTNVAIALVAAAVGYHASTLCLCAVGTEKRQLALALPGHTIAGATLPAVIQARAMNAPHAGVARVARAAPSSTPLLIHMPAPPPPPRLQWRAPAVIVRAHRILAGRPKESGVAGAGRH